MKSRLLRKSQKIRLGSKAINEIFTGVKHGKSYDDIKEIFLFMFEGDESLLKLPVTIPEHQKYTRFDCEYPDFFQLYNYFRMNQKDPLILPFAGKDLL